MYWKASGKKGSLKYIGEKENLFILWGKFMEFTQKLKIEISNLIAIMYFCCITSKYKITN